MERICFDCPAVLQPSKGRPRLRCPGCSAKRQATLLEKWKHVFKARHKGDRCPTCGSLVRK